MARINTNPSIQINTLGLGAPAEVQSTKSKAKFVITTDSKEETLHAAYKSLLIASAGILAIPIALFACLWAQTLFGSVAQYLYAAVFFAGWIIAPQIAYSILASRETKDKLQKAMRVSALATSTFACTCMVYYSILVSVI